MEEPAQASPAGSRQQAAQPMKPDEVGQGGCQPSKPIFPLPEAVGEMCKGKKTLDTFFSLSYPEDRLPSA